MGKNTVAAPESEDQAVVAIETIESLAYRLAIPDWTMVGMMAAYGWGQGKEMPEADFKAAMEFWLSGPMHRGV